MHGSAPDGRHAGWLGTNARWRATCNRSWAIRWNDARACPILRTRHRRGDLRLRDLRGRTPPGTHGTEPARRGRHGGRRESAQRECPAHPGRQQRAQGDQCTHGDERNDRPRFRGVERLFRCRVRHAATASNPFGTLRRARLARRGVRDARKQSVFCAVVLPGRQRSAGALQQLRSEGSCTPARRTGTLSQGGETAQSGERERQHPDAASRRAGAVGHQASDARVRRSHSQLVSERSPEPFRYRPESTQHKRPAVDRQRHGRRTTGRAWSEWRAHWPELRLHAAVCRRVSAGEGAESGYDDGVPQRPHDLEPPLVQPGGHQRFGRVPAGHLAAQPGRVRHRPP